MPANLSTDDLTIDERRREIVAILARDMLRLQTAAKSTTTSTSLRISESPSHGLDVGGNMRLTGPTG